MIDKLTPAQLNLIPSYLEKFKQIGLSTQPTNRAAAELALTKIYKYLKLEVPIFYWFTSPFEAIIMAAQVANQTPTPTQQQIINQAPKASYGSFEAYWVSTYSFINNELPVTKSLLMPLIEKVVEECGVYWTFEKGIIISDKPVKICMNGDNKLHNESGLALEYGDGTGVIVIDGVRYKNMVEAVITAKVKG
jgi:hypothetical protein